MIHMFSHLKNIPSFVILSGLLSLLVFCILIWWPWLEELAVFLHIKEQISQYSEFKDRFGMFEKEIITSIYENIIFCLIYASTLFLFLISPKYRWVIFIIGILGCFPYYANYIRFWSISTQWMIAGWGIMILVQYLLLVWLSALFFWFIKKIFEWISRKELFRKINYALFFTIIIYSTLLWNKYFWDEWNKYLSDQLITKNRQLLSTYISYSTNYSSKACSLIRDNPQIVPYLNTHEITDYFSCLLSSEYKQTSFKKEEFIMYQNKICLQENKDDFDQCRGATTRAFGTIFGSNSDILVTKLRSNQFLYIQWDLIDPINDKSPSVEMDAIFLHITPSQRTEKVYKPNNQMYVKIDSIDKINLWKFTKNQSSVEYNQYVFEIPLAFYLEQWDNSVNTTIDKLIAKNSISIMQR